MESYSQIADNLQGTVREDWIVQIQKADYLLQALKELEYAASFVNVSAADPQERESLKQALAFAREVLQDQ